MINTSAFVRALAVALAAIVAAPIAAQQRGGGQPQAPAVIVPSGKPTVFLWPNGAPGSEARKDEAEGIKGETVVNVHNPSIIVFLPRKDIATGVGMIVAPGGGHSSLWIMHEGFNPAQALADKGIAAFVLKNRLQSSGYKFDVEGLADMQRAIKVVRSRAPEWGVDPNKIGASGFSAGGELAQVVALQHDLGKPDATDPVERFSSRPDFQVLIYPGKSHLIQPVTGSPPAFMAAGSTIGRTSLSVSPKRICGSRKPACRPNCTCTRRPDTDSDFVPSVRASHIRNGQCSSCRSCATTASLNKNVSLTQRVCHARFPLALAKQEGAVFGFLVVLGLLLPVVACDFAHESIERFEIAVMATGVLCLTETPPQFSRCDLGHIEVQLLMFEQLFVCVPDRRLHVEI